MLRIGNSQESNQHEQGLGCLRGFHFKEQNTDVYLPMLETEEWLGHTQRESGYLGAVAGTHQGTPRLCLPHSSIPDFTCVLTATDAPLAQVRPPELEGGALQHFQCIGATATEAGS